VKLPPIGSLTRLRQFLFCSAFGGFLFVAPLLATAKEGAYHLPRLPDGQPDFQGSWEHIDAAPLERQAGISSLVLTAAEAAQMEAMIAKAAEESTTPTDSLDYFNERRLTPFRGEFHSSIIVEPQDGKLPWVPAAKDWQAKARAAVLNGMDGPEQRPTSERCLGNPAVQPPMLFNLGTNLHQIVQTKDTVVFASEWMGSARIIRLNSKHLHAAITSWLGDSIGWWEGDTLVVETKNFTPNDSGRIAMPNAYMISSGATVKEWITRVSDKELNYVFTVDDPDYYSRTWKGETHFMRTADQMLEYSCHEGNDSIAYNLRGARIKDGQWPSIKKEMERQSLSGAR
jgi:hypothetical protein